MDFSLLPEVATSCDAVKPLLPTNALWNEVKVFNRLIYKARNQHRPCRHFKLMVQLQRDLEHFARMENWLDSNASSRASVEFLGYLSATQRLVGKTRRDCRELGKLLHVLVEVNFFGPLMRLLFAATARTYMLLEDLDGCLTCLYAESLRKTPYKSELAALGLPTHVSAPIGSIRPDLAKRAPVDLDRSYLPAKRPRGAPSRKEKTVERPSRAAHGDEIDDIFNGMD